MFTSSYLHIYSQGFSNKLADTLAKETTRKPKIDQDLPLPPNYIKRFLKTNIFKGLQIHWTTSTRGRHCYAQIPNVFDTLILLTVTMKYGERGAALHLYVHCILTNRRHLKYI